MASEFYRKTKDLLEEFQKRELHYLNTERILNYKLDTSGEFNMPVQEFLQKLNKREKETEETYRGLMHHFEELDHRTESISEKLDKLNSLRISMNSTTNWYQLSKSYNEHSLDRYISPSVVPPAHILNTSFDSFQTVSTKFASTQTDNIFCGNCNSPVTVPTHLKIVPPSVSLPSEINYKPLQKADLISYNNGTVSSEIHAASDNLAFETSKIFKPVNKENLVNEALTVENPNTISDNVSNINLRASEESLPVPNMNSEEISSIKIVNTAETLSTTTELKEFVDVKQQITEDSRAINENVENIISKSDDESFNQEFDFLDSEKKHKVKKLNEKRVSEISDVNDTENNNSESNPAAGFEPSILREKEETVNNELKPVFNLNIPQTKNNLEINIQNQDDSQDKKSESSISIRDAHSPSIHSDVISAVSDSDSLYEKEDNPLQASAAYQALLGNVSVSKSSSKAAAYSESDSEDEVERVLASATRKSSHAQSTSNLQEEKSDDVKKMSDTKPHSEPRKSISLMKSQQLSKTTRKVLGLDTSSGSEGEVKVEAKAKPKIDEDSDEFDFYD